MNRFWLIFLMVALVACGGDKVDHEAMDKQVTAVHDEAMPNWFKINKLKSNVLKKAGELAAEDSTNTEIAELMKLAVDMDSAYKGMAEWMRTWLEKSEPYKTGDLPDDEITAFYKAEQAIVDKINADIQDVVKRAEEVLK